MSNVISVSRALSKSKSLLDESISVASTIRLGFVEVAGRTLDGKTAKVETDNIKKVYQSASDKINESFRLRKGINDINSKTNIDVGYGEMTIQDALAYKLYIIPAKRNILSRMISDRNHITAEYRKAKEKFDSELNALEARSEKEDVVALIEHKRKHDPKIYILDGEIEAIRAEIEYFESEFDAVMSELNPTLKFEI